MLTTDEASTSAEKDALTIRQNSEMDAKHTIQTEQANVQADEKQQKQLLSISKGNEKSYTQVVAQEAAQAAQIRAALFKLNGAQSHPVRDRAHIRERRLSEDPSPAGFPISDTHAGDRYRRQCRHLLSHRYGYRSRRQFKD